MELERKLGLKPDLTAFVLHTLTGNAGFITGPTFVDRIRDMPDEVDWLLVFYGEKLSLLEEIGDLAARVRKTGQLWIAWPKKTSGMQSDLSDDMVRSIGLSAGLVDVKIAAIDSVWSGLKFVYRLADR